MRTPTSTICRRTFRWGAVALLMFVALSPDAQAAHPLISEDTGTQGRGRFELELGTATGRDGNGRVFEFGPQLSYGVLDNLDAIVLPRWFALSGDAVGESGRRRGFGDTALDFKWRFAEFERVSLGTRAGVELPTASNGIEGHGATAYHASLIASADLSPLLLTGDVAYLRVPGNVGVRRNQYRVTAAAVYSVHERVRLFINPATESNPDANRGTWPAVLLVGVIATATSWLDVDVGLQTRLNHAAPRQVIYAGATLRW
jgi:hypothetical protein